MDSGLKDKPTFHYDYELLPCPFCGGTATALESRISCDVCLCDMAKASNQTYEELVAAWNKRKGVHTEGRMSDEDETLHYERWISSRETANPPIQTKIKDAWLARAQFQSLKNRNKTT